MFCKIFLKEPPTFGYSVVSRSPSRSQNTQTAAECGSLASARPTLSILASQGTTSWCTNRNRRRKISTCIWTYDSHAWGVHCIVTKSDVSFDLPVKSNFSASRIDASPFKLLPLQNFLQNNHHLPYLFSPRRFARNSTSFLSPRHVCTDQIFAALLSTHTWFSHLSSS